MTDKPAKGSLWRHHSGRVYRVLFLTNDTDDQRSGYPATVVYEGVANGKLWSGPLDDWRRRMTPIDLPSEARADGVRALPYLIHFARQRWDGCFTYTVEEAIERWLSGEFRRDAEESDAKARVRSALTLPSSTAQTGDK